MSEKFNSIWRKVKPCIIFIPTVVLVVSLTATAIFLFNACIMGLIFSGCWNFAMTTMFGFSKMTIVQAFVLAVTIGGLRSNYLISAKSTYEELKKKIFDKNDNEKMAKIVSVILVIVLVLISILITVCGVMYSWNSILPQLLNIELIQINLEEAFAVSYLFNSFFSIPKFDDGIMESKDKTED